MLIHTDKFKCHIHNVHAYQTVILKFFHMKFLHKDMVIFMHVKLKIPEITIVTSDAVY